MARPRKYAPRKKIDEYLTESDIYYLLKGYMFLPGTKEENEKYHEKMLNAWELYREDIMTWWHSDKVYNDLIPSKRDWFPKEERLCQRPFFWWIGRKRKRLGGYTPQSLGDSTREGMPSSYGGMTKAYPNGRGIRFDDPPCYESVYAYLKRNNLLTDEEKKLKDQKMYQFLFTPSIEGVDIDEDEFFRANYGKKEESSI